MNFLEFVNNKEKKALLVEAFNQKSLDKAHDLMLSIFKKKISKNTFILGWYNQNVADKDMRSLYFVSWIPKKGFRAFSLNYLMSSDSAEVYSISFFDAEATKTFLWVKDEFKSILTINTLGTSVAYFIPIICSVIKNDNYNISKEEAEKLGNQIYNSGKKNESYDWNFGQVSYKVCENLTAEDVEDMYYLSQGYVQESYIDETSQAQEYRWKKKQERDEAYRKSVETRSSIDKENFKRIQAEYQEIVNAIRQGAQTLDDIKMHLAKNQPVKVETPKSEKDAQEKLEGEGKDPNQAFKEMSVYVKTVIKGLQPGVIICGAPGIGKTYKIMKQLEAAGYRDGHNMEVIKGKATPRQLYLSLYNYKDKGNMLVIDDADALVGPKAPEDCINMLKAALDSTSSPEGRKISYRVTGTILDDDGNEVPKTCYYKGGVIVITNYSVGQLDTALRGRTFVQELDFSNNQLLQIIEGMLDNLGEGMLTAKSKRKALDYLKDLAESGAEMEISIRTFNTCARLFAVCEDDPDMSDDDVKSMIKEQMRNQSLRGGQKF